MDKKRIIKQRLVVALLIPLLLLSGCGKAVAPSPPPTLSPSEMFKPTPVQPTVTPEPPEGITITVTSTDDSGPGTLRQALWDAQAGDMITFDSIVFSPDSPSSIYLASKLPTIKQGYLTIDASDAGVILDGMNKGEWTLAFEITSKNNIIRGIHIQNFSGAGFEISPGADGNIIGGDREIGASQFGQGNVIVNCSDGLIIRSNGNTITGNLIGTDGSERTDSGNLYPGIALEMQASDNIIGPDNTIAYNGVIGCAGIEFRSQDAVNNRVTENTMFNNMAGSVSYIDTASDMENSSTVPNIMEFNMAEGFVNGFTCPNCIVEIFSSNSTEGEKFEGLTTADALGFYELQKEEKFEGPYLLANSFNEGQNTSSFSYTTSGLKGTKAIQEGNYSPVSKFQSQPAIELEDNRIGQMTSLHESHFSDEDDARGLSHKQNSLGLKWHRISIDWFDWCEVEDTEFFSKYSINPIQDRFIREASEDGFTILYTIVYWDDAIQTDGNYSRFQTEEEIQRYLEYIHFIVDHFKGYIQYYALLNEPNIDVGTQQYVESSDYINMVRLAVPIIRQADPEAKIIIGEVTPLYEPGAWDYFTDILRSDVISLVDGVSWHPGSASPEYMEEYHYALPARVKEITQIALANGFDGKFIASEVHFRSAINPHPTEYCKYDITAAVKYTIRNIVMFLGMEDFITGLALDDDLSLPMVENWIQNVSTVMAGATPAELTVEIESQAALIANYNFVLSNDDRLVAIWSDSIAVENDPGLNSTVAINGLSAEKVIGIDMLTGIEQELIFSIEDGKLIIRDLLIRDYPIILQLQRAVEVISER